jgi:hypothetical protein
MLTYNLIATKKSHSHIFKMFDLHDTEWGQKTTHRYFVEKWSLDSSLDEKIALEEKREFKSRNAASNYMRKV